MRLTITTILLISIVGGSISSPHRARREKIGRQSSMRRRQQRQHQRRMRRVQTLDDGEPCESDLDCSNFACARELAAVASPKLCCWSGDYVYASPSLGTVCTWQEEGAVCLDNRDELCLSNVCVDGLCGAEPVADGETCDSNADCYNYKCGRVEASIANSDMICCPSETVFDVPLLGGVCGEQEDGKACAGNDELCQSGSSCVMGICSGGTPAEEPTEAPGAGSEPTQQTNDTTPTGEPGTAPTTSSLDCISDTGDILKAEMDADSDLLRTYVLCPDTRYSIGTFNFDTFSYENGMASIEIFKGNVHILCGEDGDLDNNCIFEGGSSHVEVFYTPEGDVRLGNVIISGITFTDAKDYNAALFARGEVEFRNCKFMENKNTGILDIIGGNYEGELSVIIDGCIFEFNTVTYFEEDDGATAIVYLGGQTLTVSNSLFRYNDIVIPEEGSYTVPDDWVTSALLAFGESTLKLERNCFVDNDVYAAVYAIDDFTYSSLEEGAASNYGGGSATVCNGVADEGLDCMEFELENCPLDGSTTTELPPPSNATGGVVPEPAPAPTLPPSNATGGKVPGPAPAPTPSEAPNGDNPDPCTICPEGTELENPDLKVVIKEARTENGTDMTCAEGDVAAAVLKANSEFCASIRLQAETAGCKCTEEENKSTMGTNNFSSAPRVLAAGVGVFGVFCAAAAELF